MFNKNMIKSIYIYFFNQIFHIHREHVKFVDAHLLVTPAWWCWLVYCSEFNFWLTSRVALKFSVSVILWCIYYLFVVNGENKFTVELAVAGFTSTLLAEILVLLQSKQRFCFFLNPPKENVVVAFVVFIPWYVNRVQCHVQGATHLSEQYLSVLRLMRIWWTIFFCVCPNRSTGTCFFPN